MAEDEDHAAWVAEKGRTVQKGAIGLSGKALADGDARTALAAAQTASKYDRILRRAAQTLRRPRLQKLVHDFAEAAIRRDYPSMLAVLDQAQSPGERAACYEAAKAIAGVDPQRHLHLHAQAPAGKPDLSRLTDAELDALDGIRAKLEGNGHGGNGAALPEPPAED